MDIPGEYVFKDACTKNEETYYNRWLISVCIFVLLWGIVFIVSNLAARHRHHSQSIKSRVVKGVTHQLAYETSSTLNSSSNL